MFYFPKYPNGAWVAMTGNIIRYYADNADNLEDYAVDDAALGIWIDESPFKSKMEWRDISIRKHLADDIQISQNSYASK